MNCIICNKDIFSELDFRTIFRKRYKVHYSCLEKLKKTVEVDVFPIQNHLIEHYYIYDIRTQLNEEIVEQLSFLEILFKSKWSIDFWGNIEEFLSLDEVTQYLFWQLASTTVRFCSLVK